MIKHIAFGSALIALSTALPGCSNPGQFPLNNFATVGTLGGGSSGGGTAASGSSSGSASSSSGGTPPPASGDNIDQISNGGNAATPQSYWNIKVDAKGNPGFSAFAIYDDGTGTIVASTCTNPSAHPVDSQFTYTRLSGDSFKVSSGGELKCSDGTNTGVLDGLTSITGSTTQNQFSAQDNIEMTNFASAQFSGTLVQGALPSTP